MARLFPPILASKLKTVAVGQKVKIYFATSQFNAISEIKHAQINLYDVASNTNILSGSGTMEHKKDSSGRLLYIQKDGTVSHTVTSQPYIVQSVVLQLLFYSSAEFKTDESGTYIELPSSYCPTGKLLKTQIRLSTSAIPEQITPAWISNQLAIGALSEWSSPAVFRVVNEPQIIWLNEFSQTNSPFPAFTVSASADEYIYSVTATLNSESSTRKVMSWTPTETFEFKREAMGANTIKFKIETEGGYVKELSKTFSYSSNTREPSYYVQDYRTELGGIELQMVDEERTNRFEYFAPKAPPNMKYISNTGLFEFTRGETEFLFTDIRSDAINIAYTYGIHIQTSGNIKGRLWLAYDYVDNSKDRHDLGDILSGTQRNVSKLPAANTMKGLRGSYFLIKYGDTGTKIVADSVRMTRTKSVPVNEYVLKRASVKDGYEKWDTIVEFKADPMSSGKWRYVDNSAQSGIVYKYRIVGRDVDGSMSAPGPATFCISSAESVWVSTPKYKFLNFIFDTSISGLRIAKRETMIETLGSKYPYINTSGKMEYLTYSISTTMFREMDAAGEVLKGHFNRDTISSANDQLVEMDIVSSLELGYEKNYIVEREMREAILAELGSLRPVLIKMDGEKNIIARCTNIGLSPRKEIGNVIYSLNAQVYEVEEASIENLKKHGLLNQKVEEVVAHD